MFQSDKKRNALGTILGPDIEFSGDIKASFQDESKQIVQMEWLGEVIVNYFR